MANRYAFVVDTEKYNRAHREIPEKESGRERERGGGEGRRLRFKNSLHLVFRVPAAVAASSPIGRAVAACIREPIVRSSAK